VAESKITGTCKAQDKDLQLTGAVDGNKVTWQYQSVYNGSPITLIYTANLHDSGKVAGTVEVQPFGVTGDFTATPASATSPSASSPPASSESQTGTQRAVGGDVEADGTVDVPAFRLPPSAYLSDEAKAALPRKATDQEDSLYEALKAGNIPAMRTKIGEFLAGTIKHHADLYPVTMQSGQISGVPAVFVTPVKPMPAANQAKVLLDLPGGGFALGTAPGTGMLESIPLAALAQVRIVSITYRQGPENMFPAASEDVVAVYRELLRTHRPQDIGVFGCSAGGLLTAEAMASFQRAHLPPPGAIGIFCASADARPLGDSQAFERPFLGLPMRMNTPRNYFRDEDLSNLLASPILAPDILKHFPPTLLITATRAHDLSSAVDTQRELVKVGVEADLQYSFGQLHG
jgi:epsilon-lactone hydrolase